MAPGRDERAVEVRALVPTIVAVVRRPTLWPTALDQVRRLARPGWWRRRPFLPLPDIRWMRFRMEAAYGDADAVPRAGDVITWLRWCRSTRATG